MSVMVSTRNIASCDPVQLFDELNLDSYSANIEYLNCNEKTNGTWDIDLCVTTALSEAEDTEYQATLDAHTPA